ncbi:NfeD family protein [Denitrobaculum tricleocarpae]|uniref:NfeD family protein n=1 Tax=Denitrobaculum tricleocarpae TaxID=2591009 RepID=A0A545U1V2_9PROT|nr:NfeD family protein [Denitrobaculum tricleocarpae]TQV83452.1 NfeD family protein [Denitrobaculum tricleocarpae]
MTGFDQIEFWHWWIAAVAFAAIEVFAPSAAFVWMGASAGLVGFLLLLFPGMGWEIQFLIFAIFSVATVAGWRIYRVRHPAVLSDPNLNRRGNEYVDRSFTIEEAIVNGNAKMKIDGVIWKIRGEDLPAGSRVRVTAVESTVLRVEADP